MTEPLRIALTGGIASGKTAVSRRFAALGVPVIDADVAARRVVEPGQTGLQQLVDLCGREILQADGQLDRRALRQRIFADADLRRQVNAILHPLIRAEMNAAARVQPYPYQIFVIPLLVETGQSGDYDRVLLVEASTEQRRQRLMARDQVDADQTDAILAAQAADAARRAAADDIIDNNADEQALDSHVKLLHLRYLQLAGQPTAAP
ncbi:dephospho-CoA kinase [Permianibacter sp. IMCC34836]|uniref:dephospho-CoA kinase n=1 Tax=Permianibacter fluminis TaxID=2738515 RepID=UPI0015538BEA|nr:dephospho-CoA kinase [Permianibacter fluminis]NQD37027.1 dephospho-CoA kinase [Permianibacter fluminis]